MIDMVDNQKLSVILHQKGMGQYQKRKVINTLPIN